MATPVTLPWNAPALLGHRSAFEAFLKDLPPDTRLPVNRKDGCFLARYIRERLKQHTDVSVKVDYGEVELVVDGRYKYCKLQRNYWGCRFQYAASARATAENGNLWLTAPEALKAFASLTV